MLSRPCHLGLEENETQQEMRGAWSILTYTFSPTMGYKGKPGADQMASYSENLEGVDSQPE